MERNGKMKIGKAAVAAIGCLLLAAFAVHAEDAKWFDMENCAFCKLMTAKPGLMESINWETVKLSNGIATVETVKPEQLANYRAVTDGWEKLHKRFEKGEKMQICGFCAAMGDLTKKGVHQEYVPMSTGGITFMTSADTTLQKDIWAFHQKSEEMMKQMMPAPSDKPAEKTETK
jgi:hypothetical protein